jgi:flagellar basal-body rod protein FlgC
MNISSIMNTASSGMRAQTNRFAAVANNVANLSTPGYSRVDPATLTTDEGQPADLATEMTDMMQATQAYKANAVVFETGADLWQWLATIKRD